MAANSKITEIPLGNKPYATPFYSLGQEICQNLYLENAQSEFSKANYYLLKIPGLNRFGSIPSTNVGACRGLFTSTNGRTFAVNGNLVQEIQRDGTQSYIGNINSYTGKVSMCENGNLLMLVDGANGWIIRYTDNNFTVVSDEYFPGVSANTNAPTFVTYFDTYFIVNVPNTNQYYWSNSFYARSHDNNETEYDPTEANGYWTPLQSGQKIGRPDNIAALIWCNNYLWLFGYNSCEVHYDTGNYSGQQFARYQGAILNIGCNAPNSVAVYANNVFWLGTDNVGTLGVFSNEGMNPVRISTRGIEQMIETMTTWSDCIAYTYAQAGHSFYVMQFPSANRTFVYDTATQSWHERTKLLANTGTLVRWDGIYATSNFDKLIVGDMSSSAYYNLSVDHYYNDNPMDTGFNYIRCCKTTPINFSEGQNVRYNSVQVICNQGTGLTNNLPSGIGKDPMLQIAWSDNTGLTYSNDQPAPIGRQGEYSKRTRLLACGMGRNRVWRFVLTDPVPFILVAAIIDGSPCRF
jgi:hypothetical protein